jgi:hypothetical protein
MPSIAPYALAHLKPAPPKAASTPTAQTMTKVLDTAYNGTAKLLKALETDGKKLIFIAAADSGPDRQAGKDNATGITWVAERIAPSFLAKMTRLAQEGKIELVDGHTGGLPMARCHRTATTDELQTLGYAPGYEAFLPVFEVEPGSAAGEQLWLMAKSGTLDREFSVGGKITAARVVWDGTLGGFVKEITDGDVDHVACCRPGVAANGRTGLLGAMMKALDASGAPWNNEGVTPMATPPLGKAYVDGCGEVEITPEDIDEANEDRASYVYSSDFAAALAQLRMQQEMPMMSELLMSVLGTILNDSDVTDKRAAMKTAVDDFVTATEAVTGAALSKTIAPITVATAEGPRATPVIPPATQAGGRTMSMLKTLQGEGREKVAQLLGTTPAGLDELTVAEVFSKAATLDPASQAVLAKAMLPTPALPAGDLTSIGASLVTMDTLAKSLVTMDTLAKSLESAATKMAAAADKLAKSAEEAPAPVAAAPVEVAPVAAAPALTMDAVQSMIDTAVSAATAPPAAEAPPAAAELGKSIDPATAQGLINAAVKDALNKSLGPVGSAVTPTVSDRERVIQLVKDKGPDGALDAIFLP